MKRKTHKEFVIEIKEKNPNILILGNYINDSTKIKVKCLKCNNVWTPVPNSIVHGSGCHICAKNQKKTQEQFITEMKEYNPFIEVLGTYINAKTPLKVKCKICENEWEAKPNRLLNGAQCMNCIKPHTSFMEQFMYISLKKSLGEDEVFTRDTTAVGLELDIYIPKYRLAIEPGTWLYHKNKTKNIDLQKREECKNKGIKLITIYDTYPENELPPYNDNCYVFSGFLNENKYERLINLVKEILNIIGVKDVNLNWDEIANQAYEACHYNAHENFVNKLSKVNHNIVVLEKFKGSHTPILVKNNECNHPEWKARPYTLLNGIGCPECGRIKASKSKTRSHVQFIEELNKISKTIQVIGNYTKAVERIEVQCKICGKIWSPKAYSLINGKGCPHCSAVNASHNRKNNLKSKTTIDFKNEVKEKNRNIEVLGEYKNNKTKILVKCEVCNHQWEVVPASILNGHGCPICSKRKNKN